MKRFSFTALSPVIGAGFVLYALACASVAQSQPLSPTKRVLTAPELIDIRAVSDPQVSPDGRNVAYVVTEPADPRFPHAVGHSNIWLVPAAGGQPHRFSSSATQSPSGQQPKAADEPKDDSETQPQWAPDGTGLAFLSRRSADGEADKGSKTQVWFRPLNGDPAKRLTHQPDGVSKFAWAPDGSSIGFLARDPETPGEAKAKREGNDQISSDDKPKLTRLWTVSIKDGNTVQVLKQDLDVKTAVWSPDGSRFLISVAASSTPRDDAAENGRLLIVDRATSRLVRDLNITAAERVNSNLAWSPDGRFILAGLALPHHIDSWRALFPVAGGEPRVLLRDHAGNVEDAAFTPDGHSLIVRMVEGAQSRLYALDVASQRLTLIADHVRDTGDLGGAGRLIAYVGDDYDNPGDVWLARLDRTAKPARLTHINPQVDDAVFPSEEQVAWRSSKDGRTIYGLLFKPPGYQEGRLYPTIVEPHGGPPTAWQYGWQGSWHNWAEYLATHGYVVLMPNPRGSIGQGPEFTEANFREWGHADLQDVLDGVDMLVARKIADPARLGIGGWSYGAYLTMMAVSHTQRFKAAVTGAGMSDLISFHGAEPTVRIVEQSLGGTPFDEWDVYAEASAVRHLADAKTPTLILQGQNDPNVLPEQAVEFYHGLKTVGVEAKLIQYPREPHGPRERAHQLNVAESVLAWFDSHLKSTGAGD